MGLHATPAEEPEHAGLGGSQCVWYVHHEGSGFAVTVESTRRNIPGKASNPCMFRFYVISVINETGRYSLYTQARELKFSL